MLVCVFGTVWESPQKQELTTILGERVWDKGRLSALFHMPVILLLLLLLLIYFFYRRTWTESLITTDRVVVVPRLGDLAGVSRPGRWRVSLALGTPPCPVSVLVLFQFSPPHIKSEQILCSTAADMACPGLGSAASSSLGLSTACRWRRGRAAQ